MDPTRTAYSSSKPETPAIGRPSYLVRELNNPPAANAMQSEAAPTRISQQTNSRGKEDLIQNSNSNTKASSLRRCDKAGVMGLSRIVEINTTGAWSSDFSIEKATIFFAIRRSL